MEKGNQQNPSIHQDSSKRLTSSDSLNAKVESRIKGVLDCIDFRLLGFALPFFCSDMLAKTLKGGGTNILMIHQVYCGLLLLLFAVFAMLIYRRNPQKKVGIVPVSIVGTVALCASYFLLAAASIAQITNLYFAAVLLGGFGVSCCYLKWFSLYSLVDTKTAMVSLLLSYSLGSLLRLLFSYVTPVISLFLAAAMVLIMQYFFMRAFASYDTSPNMRDYWVRPPARIGSEEKIAPAVSNSKHMVPFIVMLLLFSLILSFVRSVNVDHQYLIEPNTLNLILRIGFPLVLIGFVAQSKWTFNLNMLYQISLVLVVTAVFLIRLFSESDMLIGIALTSFIRGMIILFLFLSFTQIIQDKRYSALSVYGVGWGIYVLAQGLGLAASTYFGLNINDSIALNIIYIVVALGVGTLIITSRQFSKAKASIQGEPGSISSSNESEQKEQQSRSSDVQDRYKLTDREVEILSLICQGRTKRYIAEALVISENTVRGHVKNLHTKCGVHSKQELIDLSNGLASQE